MRQQYEQFWPRLICFHETTEDVALVREPRWRYFCCGQCYCHWQAVEYMEVRQLVVPPLCGTLNRKRVQSRLRASVMRSPLSPKCDEPSAARLVLHTMKLHCQDGRNAKKSISQDNLSVISHLTGRWGRHSPVCGDGRAVGISGAHVHWT